MYPKSNASTAEFQGLLASSVVKFAQFAPKFQTHHSKAEKKPLPIIPGAQLLDDIVTQLKRFVVLPPYAAEVEALWVLRAHTHDVWQHSPILVLTSPTFGSGKTRNEKVLQALIPNHVKADSMSEAGLRRIFGTDTAIIIDEADTFFDDKPGFRSALNASFEKGGQAILTTKDAKTQKYTIEKLKLWAPVVIAGIGKAWIWDALESRSFVFTLKRKLRSEHADDWTDATEAEVKKRGKIAAVWAEQNMEALKNALPDIPEELQNRDRDKWRPLIAIADLVGGEWPERIRKIAIAMESGKEDTEEVNAVMLGRIKEVFDIQQEDKISSADLAAALQAAGHLEMDENSIAAVLKDFDIKPGQIKFNGVNRRGYRRDWFEGDWVRLQKVAG